MSGERVSDKCLCGAVSFEATAVATKMGARLCGLRRRWSGRAYMTAPCGGISVEDESAPGFFRQSGNGEHGFRKTCGPNLFWRMRDRSVTVASFQCLDDQSGLVFAEEIFVDDKPTTYVFANDTRKLTGGEFFARAMASQESSGG